MGVIATTLILGMSPRFIRRPLVFKFPRREGLVSLGVVVVGAGLAALAAAALLGRRLPTLLPAELPLRVKDLAGGMDSHLAVACGVMALGLAVPAAAALVVRRQPLLSTGLGRQTLKPSLQLGAALALITILLTNRTRVILDGVSAGEALGLLAAVFTGFGEEFVFRGFALPRLSAWLGDRSGWVISALLFTAWRMLLIVLFSAQSGASLAMNFLYSFLFGLILGWIQRKSGHIAAGGIYHTVHNWVQVLGLF